MLIALFPKTAYVKLKKHKGPNICKRPGIKNTCRHSSSLAPFTTYSSRYTVHFKYFKRWSCWQILWSARIKLRELYTFIIFLFCKILEKSTEIVTNRRNNGIVRSIGVPDMPYKTYNIH